MELRVVALSRFDRTASQRSLTQRDQESGWLFGDESDGEGEIFVLWDTKDHTDTAANVVRPKLDEHLEANAQAPPDLRLFKVLATK